MDVVFKKLDLLEYIDSFREFFARSKDVFLEGDYKVHYRYIMELKKLDFVPPKKIANIENELLLLSKGAVLSLSSIYEIVKIVSYFDYLKSKECEGKLKEWFAKIEIDSEIKELSRAFDKDGELKDSFDDRLASLNKIEKNIKSDISQELHRSISSSKLQPYLVDRQIHFVNKEECLLLRSGFGATIKGRVLERSAGGFFYLLPESVYALKRKEDDITSKKEQLLYEIQKNISSTLSKKLPYLKFVNREFDRFDHYQARHFFAKANELNILLPQKSKTFRLKKFKHPCINDPKPLDFEFDRSILLITGANAGGKTIFLKSLLSASLMAKYLIPMSIDEDSIIPFFKKIYPIIDDPQNSKNDLSTFAGRIREFSELFKDRGFIAGVDEIELGTDSDEAAALFKAVLDELITRDVKIVITTHHKRLAALMSGSKESELAAAIFDEERQAPTFEFLKGTIGKSYAFETALRFGIPYSTVNIARQIYGEDKERLNDLIQNSFELERELKSKIAKADEELSRANELKQSAKEELDRVVQEKKALLGRLEREYQEAIKKAKDAAKEGSREDIHRALNTSFKKYKKVKVDEPIKSEELKVGDSVKYRGKSAKIITLSKKKANILIEGIKMSVPKEEVSLSSHTPISKSSKVYFETYKGKSSNVSLDLHGLRSEEALERLDSFISDSLIAGYDEVLVYHGIGTGKLSYAVKNFLEEHPKVIEFSDAPIKMGGYGAKLVKL
ncbi:MAG: endonuclease MutS2 [Campylobacterales bacterium]